MREDVAAVGCVVMSGENTTLYTVCGNEITQHFAIDVSLPNKHGRGGQSHLRFTRLAEEARHNYISKVIEAVIRVYNKDTPLIVGGPASLKEKMAERISEASTAPKVVRIVDTQYDKRAGLQELMSQCSDLVTTIQTRREAEWINKFMTSLALDDGLSVYGKKAISYCLENGLLATLIVHNESYYEELERLCSKGGTEIVTLSSFLPEANQIKMGFGGIVGILRYRAVIPEEEEE